MLISFPASRQSSVDEQQGCIRLTLITVTHDNPRASKAYGFENEYHSTSGSILT